MASRIKAIQAYLPRIAFGKFASPKRFMELITQRTTLSPGVVKNVQESEVETLTGLLVEGQIVHTGTAIYRPVIDLDGKISVSAKVDGRLLRALNSPSAFQGEIENAERIGQSSDELVQQWNLNHPEDPVA